MTRGFRTQLVVAAAIVAAAAVTGPAARARGASKKPADIPPAVSQAIRDNKPGAEIVKEGGKGRVSRLSTPRYVYEAELAYGEVEVTADGTVLKAGK